MKTQDFEGIRAAIRSVGASSNDVCVISDSIHTSLLAIMGPVGVPDIYSEVLSPDSEFSIDDVLLVRKSEMEKFYEANPTNENIVQMKPESVFLIAKNVQKEFRMWKDIPIISKHFGTDVQTKGFHEMAIVDAQEIADKYGIPADELQPTIADAFNALSRNLDVCKNDLKNAFVRTNPTFAKSKLISDESEFPKQSNWDFFKMILYFLKEELKPLFKIVVTLVTLWLVITSGIQRFRCPEMTETQLFKRIPKTVLCDFKDC